MKARVIFIPGNGDRAWAYRLASPLWRLCGYKVHVEPFGWSSNPRDFEGCRAYLEHYVDRVPSDLPLYVVGGSAGGIAAVNLLAARPERISKIAVIATPLGWGEQFSEAGGDRYSMLAAALKPSSKFLAAAGADVKAQIVSFYGRDQLIPAEWTGYEGVQRYRLPMAVHGLIIGAALTIFCRRVQRQLEGSPS